MSFYIFKENRLSELFFYLLFDCSRGPCNWTFFSNKKCLRNSKCFDWQIWRKDNVPPMLTAYTNGGLKHHSNFLNAQIAMITLQRFLHPDILIAARTASGHSYTNPFKKIIAFWILASVLLDAWELLFIATLDLKSNFVFVLVLMK